MKGKKIMKKVTLVLLVMFVCSVSVFSQAKSQSSFQNISFGGVNESNDGGFRFVGEVQNDGKNWKALSGYINDGLMAEKNEYSGCSFNLKIDSEQEGFKWVGLLYKEVPVRRVNGTITIKNNFFHNKIVIKGSFNIVQALADADYQKQYNNKVVIIEGWHTDYTVKGLDGPKTRISKLRRYLKNKNLVESTKSEDFSLSTKKDGTNYVVSVSYKDKELGSTFYHPYGRLGSQGQPKIEISSINNYVIAHLAYDIDNDTRANFDCCDLLWIINKSTGEINEITPVKRIIWNLKYSGENTIQYLTFDYSHDNQAYLVTAIINEPGLTHWTPYNQGEMIKANK